MKKVVIVGGNSGIGLSFVQKFNRKHQIVCLNRKGFSEDLNVEQHTFDVLTDDIERTAMIVEERLHDSKFTHIKQIRHAAIGEIVPEHIEIRYKDDILAFIYKPMACHNYNTVVINNQDINVATIDTIMSFYLAFLYAGANYYYNDRILCTAKFLFELEQKNRLSQTGVLKRFTSQCMGVQETMESIRAKKSEKFEELRGVRGSEEYEKYFLKYSPGELDKRKNKIVEVEVKQPISDIEAEVERLNSVGIVAGVRFKGIQMLILLQLF